MAYMEDLKVCKFRVRQTTNETRVYKFNMPESVKQHCDIYERFAAYPRDEEIKRALICTLRHLKNNTTFIGIYGERNGLKSVYEIRGDGNEPEILQAECYT